jgi:hypothetical protein
LIGSYMYVFCYLAFPPLRRPIILELVLWVLYCRTNFLSNILKLSK